MVRSKKNNSTDRTAITACYTCTAIGIVRRNRSLGIQITEETIIAGLSEAVAKKTPKHKTDNRRHPAP